MSKSQKDYKNNLKGNSGMTKGPDLRQ